MTNPGREVIRTRCRRGASFDSHTVLALLNRLEAAERERDDWRRTFVKCAMFRVTAAFRRANELAKG